MARIRSGCRRGDRGDSDRPSPQGHPSRSPQGQKLPFCFTAFPKSARKVISSCQNVSHVVHLFRTLTCTRVPKAFLYGCIHSKRLYSFLRSKVCTRTCLCVHAASLSLPPALFRAQQSVLACTARRVALSAPWLLRLQSVKQSSSFPVL